jgi:hypothetical protein
MTIRVETDAGTEPITILAFEAGASDWLPARGFHPGPEPVGLQTRGRRYDCSPTCVRSVASRYLREESRYEVLGDAPPICRSLV